MPLFDRILIANRGEIAVRIEQTCREMGIETVAVYSSADAGALHRRLADVAIEIGPPPATESYLNIDALLRAARESGAQAVHPGYGFLSENAAFARAVLEAGLIWIGPPPDTIALLGDKVAARALAASTGLPVVPGYDGEDQSDERLRAEAERVGLPVMVKAAAGGGGKGMRAVFEPERLLDALNGARREARAAFGDDRLFLEKLIVRPRHVEIQVLLDSAGRGVYLGERDCTVQRRHQKVLEEAPSPVLTGELRDRMGSDALRLARASGYVNAGTVEFLFGGDSYYFLEVNTRIQVEHPVTELVTGLDLVRRQIEIAAGEPLGLAQTDIVLRGHAIEARIYAEDAAAGFLPSSGELTDFQPPLGPGIRNDTGVRAGDTITTFYDPMLAKLVVHAGDRPAAVARLRDALQRYAAAGPTLNLDFLRWAANSPEFGRARIDIEWVDRAWRETCLSPTQPDAGGIALAALWVVLTGAEAVDAGVWAAADAWRLNGSPRTVRLLADDQTYVTVVERSGEGWSIRTGGDTMRLVILSTAPDRLTVESEGRVLEARIGRSGTALSVTVDNLTQTFNLGERGAGRRRSGGTKRDAPTAPMPGTVIKLAVQEGDRVDAHQPLVVMEAMKMEHVVEAPHAGRVRAVLVREGDLLSAGAPVVELEEE